MVSTPELANGFTPVGAVFFCELLPLGFEVVILDVFFAIDVFGAGDALGVPSLDKLVEFALCS